MSRPFHEVSLSDGSFVLASVPAARIFGSFTQRKMFAFTEFAPSETAQVSLWMKRLQSRVVPHIASPGIFAPVLITRTELGFGWRSPFLALGLIVIVAGFFCYAYSVDRQEQNARVNSSELALISGPAETEAGPVQKNISQKIRVP
jgi:hypothetical protein